MTIIHSNKKELSPKQREELFRALKTRFEKNKNRHKGLQWAKVQTTLEAKSEKLWSLNEMEGTGGEPDVVGLDKKTGEYIFYDCSAESPQGRRSLCYDREAMESRKEFKPKGNALDMAAAMGIEISGNSAELSSVIAVTTLFLCIITEQNPTMPPGGSVAR
jgi:hypothetical protein